MFEIEQGPNQPSAKEVKSLLFTFPVSFFAFQIERTLEAGGAETVGTYLVDCIPYTPREKVNQKIFKSSKGFLILIVNVSECMESKK